MRALIVYGGPDFHEPKPTTEVVTEFLRECGMQVEVSDSLETFSDAVGLMQYDLIIPNWTMGGQLSGAQCTNLVRAVSSGCGLAGWHGGMGDAFSNHQYQWMTGGLFMGHPGNKKQYGVRITRPDDPVMAGLADFEMNSEQYYMLFDPRVEVLADTTFHTPDMPWLDGMIMPVVWKTMWGQGRVFYSALGHVASELQIPQVKQILVRGMQWACRQA